MRVKCSEPLFFLFHLYCLETLDGERQACLSRHCALPRTWHKDAMDHRKGSQ
jgi:hypothetical protein